MVLIFLMIKIPPYYVFFFQNSLPEKPNGEYETMNSPPSIKK